MAYINSKATRFWVHPTWVTEDGAPVAVDAASLEAAGWHFVKGVRSDNAANTPNTQEFNHYGEEEAVVIRGKPNRSIDLPLSEDLTAVAPNDGQDVIRWASANDENLGVLVLKDADNGYAVLATATYSQEAGDAGGVLRAAQATLSPIEARQYVGASGIYEPGS